MLVFLEARLYLQSALQVVYVLLAIQGWRAWRGQDDADRGLAVRRVSMRAHLAVLAATVLLTAANVSGASDYFKGNSSHRMEKQPFKPDSDEFYTTDANVDVAIRFIEEARERDPRKPFFLYLAYNAVHSPQQAPQEDIERYRKSFPDIGEDRQILMTMLYHLDLGVGAVVNKLKKEQLWENTLLFFLTDNGRRQGNEREQLAVERL